MPLLSYLPYPKTLPMPTRAPSAQPTPTPATPSTYCQHAPALLPSRPSRVATLPVGRLLLILVTVGAMLAGSAQLWTWQRSVDRKQAEVRTAAQPATVEVTELTALGCAECAKATNLEAVLKGNAAVRLDAWRSVDYASADGKTLAQAHGLTRVPSAVVTGETAKLQQKVQAFAALGSPHADGSLAVSNLPAPYLDIASGQVRGRVTLTLIADARCSTCYDPNRHPDILKQFGLSPDVRTVDRSDADGKKLVRQYGITVDPTYILTGDLAAYPSLVQLWSTVGTVEPDGAYVFRSGVAQMGTYYDLTKRTTVTPPPPTTTKP